MDSENPSETLVAHLERSLEAETVERKDYHVRQALQVAVAVDPDLDPTTNDR